MTPADRFYLYLLIFILVCGFLGAIVGGKSSGLGFVLGALLGPFGVIAAAVVGNRAALEAMLLWHQHAAGQYPPTQEARLSVADPAARSPLAGLPSELTIRRKGELIGTWPLADVLEYLTDGRLLPTDEYRKSPKVWSLLKHLQ